MSSKSQVSMKSYFGVKRRGSEHGAVKRRKLDDLTREDIPAVLEGRDTDSPVNKRKFVTYGVLRNPSDVLLLPSPKKSPITAKSCQSPRKTPSSPYRFESRGATSLRMALGRPAPDSPGIIPDSPKLEKFEMFEFKSPQRKPSASRHLNYSSPTPAELKLKKTSVSPAAAKIGRATSLRMALGRPAPDSPAASTTSSGIIPDSPKLEKFEIFEFKSPQKKPSASRRLNYSLLTQPTPAELKLKKTSVSPAAAKVVPETVTSSKPRAYQRFHSLAQPQRRSDSVVKSISEPTGPEESSQPQSVADLPLPYGYQLLAEKFRSVDTVTSMLQKRSETCTFDKLRQSVQQMTRRNFERKNLAQMKSVYPKAYIFRQEKNIPGTTDKTKYSQYQLTVECTAHEGEEPEGGASKLPMGKGLYPAAMIKRRKRFNKNLLDIVINYHKTFLSSLDPPIEVTTDKLFRWHPAFPLDGVPEVEETELPKPPLTESYTTAKDVLEATKNKVKGRVKAALQATAATAAAAGQGAKGSTEKSKATCSDPSLRGVSSGLLERIRQKETARAKADIMRNPEKEKQLSILNRLPEMCRIIRSLFVTEGKAALMFDDVVKKIKESHSSGITPDQVEEHVELLLEVLKEWIQKIYIKKAHYLKLKSKNTTLKKLTQILQRKATELQGP